MAYFPYVTFVSVVSFNDVTIPAFCFCRIGFYNKKNITRWFSPPCNILYLFYFFFYAMLNIRIIVGPIHVPAYAKLVILETETLALQRFVKVIEQLLQCDFKF